MKSGLGDRNNQVVAARTLEDAARLNEVRSWRPEQSALTEHLVRDLMQSQ